MLNNVHWNIAPSPISGSLLHLIFCVLAISLRDCVLLKIGMPITASLYFSSSSSEKYASASARSFSGRRSFFASSSIFTSTSDFCLLVGWFSSSAEMCAHWRRYDWLVRFASQPNFLTYPVALAQDPYLCLTHWKSSVRRVHGRTTAVGTGIPVAG